MIYQAHIYMKIFFFRFYYITQYVKAESEPEAKEKVIKAFPDLKIHDVKFDKAKQQDPGLHAQLIR